MAVKKLTKTIRNQFIAGIIIIIPVWVTILMLRAVIGFLDRTFTFLPRELQPQTYLPFPGVGLVIALLLIFLVGFFANNFFGKKFIVLVENILAKIPVIKTIYQGVKHLTAGVMSDKKIFSRVVLLEFPIKGLLFIGFVTGEDSTLFPDGSTKKMLKVFIPTTPNPTSGFFCLAAEEQVKPLDISVDEAFKLIISAGYAKL